MQTFIVIWTFVANYGKLTVEAENAEKAAERVFAGFSDEFRLKGTCYVVPKNELVTVKGGADGYEYNRG